MQNKAWAKTEGGQRRLSLTDHSIDVAATAEALLWAPGINRRLAALARPALLDKAAIHRLAFLIGLHDAGKVVHGFQARLRGDRPDCGHIGPLWDVLTGGTPTDRDEALKGDALRALGGAYWQGWFEPYDPDPTSPFEPPSAEVVGGWYWQAILAHHGSLPEKAFNPSSKEWRPRGGYAPLEALAQLTAALQTMFPAAFGGSAGKLPGSPRFLHALAGLVTLADWLGSDQSVFRFPSEGPDLPTGAARIPWARQQATALVARRGLDPARWQADAAGKDTSFTALFGLPKPRPAQAHLLSEPLPAPGQITTLEAETGSGKTEAALAHFFRLFQAGEVDGLYFALPTRAAAVQIQTRVSKTLQRWFVNDGPPVSLAVPGYLRVDEAEGQCLPDGLGVLWPDEADRDRTWSVERAKSYLSGTVMVGTVDQVLMGGLQVKHAQFRSGPMLRLLLVVDEVHASDAYMGVILRNVLDQHVAAGGHALLMSATLGAEARAQFLHIGKRGPAPVPSLSEAEALPYPAVQRRGESLRALDHDGRRKQVAVDLIEPDALQPLLERVAEAAKAGAAVLFIRNTVVGAREAFTALEELGAPLLTCAGVETPHHSRYAPDDRRRLDRALEAAFADPPAGVRPGVVAVTTQTAEQSLDICADWLVTDLCPGDVLLQRVGRLHRHARQRPAGFGQARVSVIAPTAEELAPAINRKNGEVRGKSLLGLGRVYGNIVGVLATRQWLAARGAIGIPTDNRALVEAATHRDSLENLAERLGEPWGAHCGNVIGEVTANKGVARINCLKWNEPIAENRPSPDQRIMTRLGLNDRRIDLPEPLPGPFGSPVSGFNLPGWMSEGLADGLAASEIIADAGEIRFRFGELRFRYDRLGLTQIND